ncbi:MAG: conjugal transfer protein TraF [Elusimicrobiota bacterium]|nr:MAG: conjugal transfer protein TraF [Elusimicrobiota bacterium]
MASYWNPAALGRQTSNAHGVAIPFGIHAALTGNVIEGANDLEALKNSAAVPTDAQINAALNKIDQPGSGLRVDGDIGVVTKAGRLSIFVNGTVDAGAVPQVDRVNTAAANIQNGTNNSKLIVRGANIAEFGAAYGREIDPLPGLYLGGALKLMSANVGYVDYFVLRENNDEGNIVSKLKDGSRRSANIGVDAGLLWDLDRSFGGVALKPRLGLVGRNLNNPSFKQPDAAIAAGYADKFKVNPQVRLGASLQPFNWWNLAADMDLTRNLTLVNAGSRQLGVGSEFNVFNRSWINIPLRVGLRRNVDETSAGTMLTLGAGLNFLHVMFDASAAVSNKRTTLQSQGEQKKTPREAAVGFQLSVLFGGSDEEPAAPSREWKAAPPPADYQPAPTSVIKNADKAHEDLKVEELKKAGETKPTTTRP